MRGIVTIGLLIAVTATARAQTIRVRVVSDARPIPGALVSLRDESGRVVARALADDRGRATVTAPAAGVYRVRADAIGFKGSLADALALASGETRALELALVPQPFKLDDIVVKSSRSLVCNLEAEQGTLLARLWEEARKALQGTTLTRTIRPPTLEITTYERRLDRSMRVINEKREVRQSNPLKPFVSADPELLHQYGYVQSVDQVDTWFHAPDADLLLSDRFLEDHCFEVIPRSPGDTTAVGLGFRPAPHRNLPEVKGTLWIDAKTAHLKTLEFRYTNVDLPFDALGAGGRVEFARMPNGAWIVSRWSIRMPSVVRIVTRVGRRDSLAGYQENGGEAVPVETVNRAVAGLTGTVFDSTTGRLLEGVVVSIAGGAYADTTDAAGFYRIETPTQGDFAVSYSHPRFYLFGLAPVVRSARLTKGEIDTVRVATPGTTQLRQRLCPRDTVDAETTVLVGRAVDSVSGAPLTGRTVTTQWGGFALRRAAGRVAVNEQGTAAEIDTDDQGVFRLCGVPTGRDVTVRIGRAVVRIRPKPDRIAEVELKGSAP